MVTGYTQGTFDLFHVGHLNLLKAAKEQCDYLVVGVNSDRLVQEYKDLVPTIPDVERIQIVAAIRYVDEVFLAETLDKVELHNLLDFDKIFIGDDWKGNARWEQTEKEMRELGVDFVWLHYTQGISSTLIRGKIESAK